MIKKTIIPLALLLALMLGCQLTSENNGATGIAGRENIVTITNGEEKYESELETVEAYRYINTGNSSEDLIMRLKINESEGIILKVEQFTGQGRYRSMISGSQDFCAPTMQYFANNVLYFPNREYTVTITSVTPELRGVVECVELINTGNLPEEESEKLELSFAFSTGNVKVESQVDIPEIPIEETVPEEMITREVDPCLMAALHAATAAAIYNQIITLSSQWWNPFAGALIAALWPDYWFHVITAADYQSRC
jgi:hypothetical protein